MVDSGMTLREFWNSGLHFFNTCTVYYVVQLVRCALLSFIVFAFVLTLRNTALKNRVFLKGALWSLFIPVLFTGRMKFFYENRIGVKLFSRLTEMCINHVWICRLYLCGVLLYAALLFRRRRKLEKMVADMEKRKADGTVIYVAKIPVTPSAVGVFRPKIVMPEVILNEYDQKEFQTILLHEKTHIRLGHLLFYFLWDILRALLWPNPFLAIGTTYFREDMEEICDWVTMKRSEGKAYTYGQLLLKSMWLLQAESKDFNMYVTFTGDKEYQSVRRRVTRIARYKSYKSSMAVWIGAVSMICVIGSIFCLNRLSYERFYENNSVSIFGMDEKDILLTDDEGKIISHDKQYIYIDMDALQTVFQENGIEEQILFVYCGDFCKLPGIGTGGGFGYVYEENYAGGIQRIPYEDTEDIWTTLLKAI